MWVWIPLGVRVVRQRRGCRYPVADVERQVRASGKAIRACTRWQGWLGLSPDTHALDCDVAQNLRSSMTWQISVGGVVVEQLEWDVTRIEIQ